MIAAGDRDHSGRNDGRGMKETNLARSPGSGYHQLHHQRQCWSQRRLAAISDDSLDPQKHVNFHQAFLRNGHRRRWLEDKAEGLGAPMQVVDDPRTITDLVGGRVAAHSAWSRRATVRSAVWRLFACHWQSASKKRSRTALTQTRNGSPNATDPLLTRRGLAQWTRAPLLPLNPMAFRAAIGPLSAG